MRSLVLFAAFTLVLGLLAACATTTEDADDDPVDDTVAEEPSPTPEPDDAADDMVDDAAADDAVADDEAVDDATDDAADDVAVDDATDDEAADDAADDAMADDAADDTATDDATDDADAEPTEHEIELQDPDQFVPDELEIAAGDTVTFVNAGNIPHTATLDPDAARDPENIILPDDAETWDSGTLDPGDEFTITLEVPGEYQFVCLPHEALGMIGTITVNGEGSMGGNDDEDDDSYN